MNQGTVKWFNKEKGFGFIKSEDKKDYFVHYSNIIGGSGMKTLEEGQNVTFEIESTDKGPRAVKVKAE